MCGVLFSFSLLYVLSVSIAFIMLALSRGQVFNPYSYHARVPIELPGKACAGEGHEVFCCFEGVLVLECIKQVETGWQYMRCLN